MLSYDKLLSHYITPLKQGAKRHYGIHPYFTRRPWNVVQEYIEHYTPEKNALVLDPFGGSGVTAIEAAVLGHTGIQFDINPLANFIAKQIAKPDINITKLMEAGEGVLKHAQSILKGTKHSTILKKYWYPKDIELPKNADVIWVEELFTEHQLAELAVLRDVISAVKPPEIRDLLLLAFSSTLAKTNRTFISAKNRAETRGGSTILSLYRYHVPKNPVELLPLVHFSQRLSRLIQAKKETNELITQSGGTTKVITGSATDLSQIEDESIDYVFTDPPYGSFINYLDLSTMWNAWLGFKVSSKVYDTEIISSSKDDTRYFALLEKSAAECFRTLKYGAYLSLVFCHRDLSYWRRIYEMFSNVGFNYKISVAQPISTVWSVHKKKCDLASLAGEVIITFRKEKRRDTSATLSKPKSVERIIGEIFRSGKTLSTDELCLKLIPRLYEAGILEQIGTKKLLLADFLKDFVRYSEINRNWTIA